MDLEADPMEAVVYVQPGLGILPASSGVPDLANLGPEDHRQLGEILRSIAGHFDIVLVDTAAGIGPSVLWFNTFVEYNLLVLTPDPTAMTDAYALIKVLSRDHQRKRFQVLVNQVKNDQEARQVYDHLARVASHFLNLSLIYLGAVPRDEAVSQGVRNQAAFVRVAPRSKAAQALARVAEFFVSRAEHRSRSQKKVGETGG